MYMDVVNYAKHLEKLLLHVTDLRDDEIQSMRSEYIKPATNVAKEWLEEESK